jgi:ABC-type branched-subunit amino acid transport system ATPase component/ABC-type branched-subunit amino acid transport system permease subunit
VSGVGGVGGVGGVSGVSGVSGVMLRRLLIALAGAGLAFAVGPLGLVGDYTQFIIALLAIAFIAVLSVNLLAGLCGIWSLGHSAYVALGAYLAANLTALGVPIEVICLAAMAASALLGFILGLSAGRFSVLYFGLLTMALALVATEVIGRWTQATGGDDGMKVEPAITLFAATPIETRNAVVICVLLATAVYLIGDAVNTSRYGRRWLAVKGQRTAAMAMGLTPHVENARAFALSAALASLSGVCMAFTIAFIDPVAFSLDASITMIVGTVVGGVGSSLGALLGAVFITAVPELARDAPALANFVYGGAMIVVLLWLGQGIVPALRDRLRKLRGRHAVASAGRRGAVDALAISALVSQLLPAARQTLSLKNVSLSFSGLKALDDVSFELPPGTAVGLIGPNGAGKTSLLNVLSGFYKPMPDTSVMLGDVNVLAAATSGRAMLGIGRTFQHAELFPELTIRDMLITAAGLALPLRRRHRIALRDPRAVADLILDGLALRPHADSFPTELPFGVQKVADIGRVLAIGASVVSMDEPFSGLDEQECAELRAILRGMRSAGVSILIIDHAVQEVLDLCDKVVVLDFGRLLAAGDPEMIRRDPEVRKAYFGSLQLVGDKAEDKPHG